MVYVMARDELFVNLPTNEIVLKVASGDPKQRFGVTSKNVLIWP